MQRKYFILSLGYDTQKKMAHLTLVQRYEIAALRKQDFSQIKIADIIGRNKSVICRELARNADGRNGVYKAELAQKKAEKRQAEKPKKIYFTEGIRAFVITWLEQDYSPEQIVGYAKKNLIKCVSHERIYEFIWQDKKSGGDYYIHLRTQGKKYRKRGQIVGRVDIDQRPAIVEEKSRFGDLEMDLVIGKNHNGALLTINDRATGMLKMVKIDSKESQVIQDNAIEILQDWKPLLQTITSDNGKEFANHKSIANALEIAFFFAKPYHPWERGANENLNGLIRQYFPKKYDFDSINPEDVIHIQNKLNHRLQRRTAQKKIWFSISK